jgi:hypothetical protein
MKQRPLVYKDNRLCVLDWEVWALSGTMYQRDPSVMVYWWPVSEPIARSRLDVWLGDWDGEKYIGTWEGMKVYHLNSTTWTTGKLALPIIERGKDHKRYALYMVDFPYPKPKVKGDLRWGAEYGGRWERYSSRGYVPIDTRFEYNFQDGKLIAYFEQWKGEKTGWKRYSDILDLEEIARKVEID